MAMPIHDVAEAWIRPRDARCCTFLAMKDSFRWGMSGHCVYCLARLRSSVASNLRAMIMISKTFREEEVHTGCQHIYNSTASEERLHFVV